MWTVGTSCPEFRVRTPAGVVGRDELRPAWIALLHCTRPCTKGCSACLAGFERLGRQVASRNCRLVVALDEPDAELRARLGQMPADLRAPVLMGTWETPEARHAPHTLFAVIDPAGTVRAVLEGSNATPLPAAALLEQLDQARGQSPVPSEWPAIPTDDRYGCVEWFDYDTSGGPTPGAH